MDHTSRTSEPDGYTIMMGHMGTHGVRHPHCNMILRLISNPLDWRPERQS